MDKIIKWCPEEAVAKKSRENVAAQKSRPNIPGKP